MIYVYIYIYYIAVEVNMEHALNNPLFTCMVKTSKQINAKEEPSYTELGVTASLPTVELHMEVSQKTNTGSTVLPNFATPGHFSEGLQVNTSQKD